MFDKSVYFPEPFSPTIITGLGVPSELNGNVMRASLMGPTLLSYIFLMYISLPLPGIAFFLEYNKGIRHLLIDTVFKKFSSLLPQMHSPSY